MQLARPRSDAVIEIPCFPFIVHIEAVKVEISTAKTDRGGLSGRSGTRSEGAELDDRVGDPCLAGSSRLAVGGRRRGMNKDNVVGCEMYGAADLCTTSREGHIVDLERRLSAKPS